MSAAGPTADEIAEDYRNALEDLAINTRAEVHSLTTIAKENLQHAVIIANVLENHVLKTNPDRKLPALYVLDSVVKNVGSPYSVIFGKNLYKTFMDTYSRVNNSQLRRKLDELLLTWKQPVPGMLDTRPVFPSNVTKPIESALIQWRTKDIQRQQVEARSQQLLHGAGRPGAPAWHGTPPPQHAVRYPQPPPQGYTPQPMPNGNTQIHSHYPGYPQYSPQPTPPVSQQPYHPPPSQSQYPHRPVYQHPPQHLPSLDSLFADITRLIDRYKTAFANNYADPENQTKLQALLQLQTLLRSQNFQPHELEAIQAQLTQLAAAAPSVPTPMPHTYHSPPAAASNPPLPYSPEPNSSIYQPPPTPPVYNPSPAVSAAPAVQLPPVQQPQPDLSSLFNSNALASLLASVKGQTPAPPVAQTPLPPPQAQYSQPPSTPMPAATALPNSLIASLRAAGMLPPDSNTLVNGSSLAAPNAAYSVLGSNTTSSIPRAAPAISIAAQPMNDVELTSASLKIPRPHLVRSLFEAFPNQCSTCGKRFLSTPEGKKKKARHLDWHFQVGMKREEAAKRGQSRSWYVSELEWIKWREPTEDGEDIVANGAKTTAAQAAAAAEAAQKDPKNKFILVPSDHALANAPCPICQEPFEKSYDDSISDWVWKDAIKVGSRVFHASEYAELKSDGGHTPNRTSTPDSVLGKRGRDAMESSANSKTLKVA